MKATSQNLRQYVMGLFTSEEQAAEAVTALKASSWKLHRVHSPVPSHRIADALALKKSRVGLFTLAGGIIGFFSGFALAAFTAARWDLIVGGKPVVALIPFFIVGFEFTILFAVFGNIIGFLITTGLPNFKGLALYDERCSGEHFGILASCDADQHPQLVDFFISRGGLTRIFDTPPSHQRQGP